MFHPPWREVTTGQPELQLPQETANVPHSSTPDEGGDNRPTRAAVTAGNCQRAAQQHPRTREVTTGQAELQLPQEPANVPHSSTPGRGR